MVCMILPVGTLAADSKASGGRPDITLQPVSKTAFEDRNVSFTVNATGTGLKYQWYYRNSSTDTWKVWTGRTAKKLEFSAYASRSGHQYTCKVTNSAGKYIFSKTATLYVNKINYRALLVGQKYANFYDPNSRLPACEKDAYRMKSMLASVKGAKGRNWYVTTKIDLTYSGLQSAIKTAFANADDNDVNLFYYSGHGTSSGSLCTVNGSYIDTMSTYTLASLLKNVKGKVIVMLDCCYSGAAIGKDMGSTASDPDSFNDAVVKAFAAENGVITDYTTDATAKSGELATSKFLVLTASNKNQMSWCNNDYGYFTYYVALGSKGAADTDKNKKVSLNELYNYVYRNAKGPYYSGGEYYYQYTQVYPTGSYYTLFATN